MAFMDYHRMLSPCKSECNQRGKLPIGERTNGNSNDEAFCTSCGRTRSEIAAWGGLSEDACLKVLQKVADRKRSYPDLID